MANSRCALRPDPLGVVHRDDADPDDLVVDAHRVIAEQPVPDLEWVRLVGAVDLDIQDGPACLQHAPVQRFDRRPDQRHEVGNQPTHLLGDGGFVERRQGFVDQHTPVVPIDEAEANRRL